MKTTAHDQIAKKIFTVAPGVWGMKDVFVNFYMIKDTSTENDWVLVDAGLRWSAPKIRKMANFLFGEGSKPTAIVLTHGHFDHVGSLSKLAEEWDVPVYAHYMEIPYLTGKSSYPPPDPTVGGGLMTYMAWVYPSSPIDIWSRINVLPAEGMIPGLKEWKWIHTPGHSPGHVSFYRELDRVLIAGDAFVTTNQESAFSVMMQKKKMHGPPKYFTYDWIAAENSVMELADLHPKVAASGHGKPMRGDELRDALLTLSQHFSEIAVPSNGRYAHDPAVTDANGVVYLPQDNFDRNALALKVVAVTSVFVLALILSDKKKKVKKRKIDNLLDVEYNF